MNTIDTVVLFCTLATIVSYGVWKTRVNENIESYLLGNKSLKWGTIGLSVMATQASAITFISTPGQGYQSGMAFVQNYLGLPIALIIVATVFIPIYYRLKVYTAYEFLENRFDTKTRLLGATLFLIQRGLAAGITIYAPAIILSPILHWDLNFTIFMVGGLVIIYTVSGGSRAVSITQKQQMTIIMVGMFAAFGIMLSYLGDFVSFNQALKVAGNLGKLNAIDLDFSFEKRYTIWSGLAAGIFLQLSYFGTDQSQVARYLGGKSPAESKLGLMFNAILKIPMQFFILLIGAMLYVFYIFYTPPVHFNETVIAKARQYDEQTYRLHESAHIAQAQERAKSGQALVIALDSENPQSIAEAKANFDYWDAELLKSKEGVKNIIYDKEPEAELEESSLGW